MEAAQRSEARNARQETLATPRRSAGISLLDSARSDLRLSKGQGSTVASSISMTGMKILLIRLRLIGDVVFTTPAIAALRGRFPAAHISYLVEATAEPVVRDNPHLTEVIVAERPKGLRRITYDLRLARRLRRARFDVVVDFHGGPRSAWLTRATGAGRRIGYRVPAFAPAQTRECPAALGGPTD